MEALRQASYGGLFRHDPARLCTNPAGGSNAASARARTGASSDIGMYPAGFHGDTVAAAAYITSVRSRIRMASLARTPAASDRGPSVSDPPSMAVRADHAAVEAGGCISQQGDGIRHQEDGSCQ